MTTTEPRLLANRETIQADLVRIAQGIVEQVTQPEQLLVVGIQIKGVWIAEFLRRMLSQHWDREIASGTLDVGMHRDDLGQNPLPNLQPTTLPASVTDKIILLVDDVIHSGRTIRAALDSLHDFGRPDRVMLAALIDRGGRRLPITPDFIGREVKILGNERIQVSALDDLDGFEVHVNTV